MAIFGDLSGIGAAANALSGIIGSVSGVIEKLVPDPDLKAKLQHETEITLIAQATDLQKSISDAAKSQAEINLKEAESPSLFVSGWRPAVGWVCVTGLTYGVLLQPLISWGSGLFHGPAAPAVDSAAIVSLLMALLGLGGMRTYEKVQGVDRQSLTSPAAGAVKKMFG